MIPHDWNVGQVEWQAAPNLLAFYGDEDYLLEDMQECLLDWWRESENQLLKTKAKFFTKWKALVLEKVCIWKSGLNSLGSFI